MTSSTYQIGEGNYANLPSPVVDVMVTPFGSADGDIDATTYQNDDSSIDDEIITAHAPGSNNNVRLPPPPNVIQGVPTASADETSDDSDDYNPTINI
eukprot:343484_1